MAYQLQYDFILLATSNTYLVFKMCVRERESVFLFRWHLLWYLLVVVAFFIAVLHLEIDDDASLCLRVCVCVRVVWEHFPFKLKL